MIYDHIKKRHFALNGMRLKPNAVALIQQCQRLAIANETPEEKLFAEIVNPFLRGLGGATYVKQKPFAISLDTNCRVDFYFQDFRLAVEIDGPQHRLHKQKTLDAKRAHQLKHFRGINTLRYKNEEIRLDNLENVIIKLVNALLDCERGYKKFLIQFMDYYNANGSSVEVKPEQALVCPSASSALPFDLQLHLELDGTAVTERTPVAQSMYN